ncbi:MAG: peptidase [Parcubacteria group bacterium]|nr:peptidase [Parcubacteria group bacterium]
MTVNRMQFDLATTIFALIVLFFSIIIHEVAHGYAAKSLGDPTASLAGRLTLNPLAHIDPVGSILVPALLIFSGSGLRFGWAKPVPYNPSNLNKNAFARRWGESMVAVAGVATNLLLALIFALVARAAIATGQDQFATLAAIVTITNLSLGLFNLIPIPPLDGYTFLSGLLPFRYAYSFRRFEQRIWQGGIFSFVIILILFNYVFAAPFSAFVGWAFHLLVGA